MPITRRSFLFALLPSSTAARADLYDDYINSKSKKPFVAFLGRKSGTVGHAFTGVGTEIDSGLRVYERFFGLYPAEGGKLSAVKLVFSKTSGRIDHTWNDVSWDVQFRRDITPEQKEAVLAQFQKWSADTPQYSLLANDGKNCNAMVADVAKVVGLQAPAGAGTTFPWNYIEELKKLNAK